MKKLLSLSIVSGFILANLVTTVANAAPIVDYYQEYTYYSDASHTNAVGDGTRTCSGRFFSNGTVTPYYTIDISIPCK